MVPWCWIIDTGTWQRGTTGACRTRRDYSNSRDTPRSTIPQQPRRVTIPTLAGCRKHSPRIEIPPLYVAFLVLYRFPFSVVHIAGHQYTCRPVKVGGHNLSVGVQRGSNINIAAGVCDDDRVTRGPL